MLAARSCNALVSDKLCVSLIQSCQVSQTWRRRIQKGVRVFTLGSGCGALSFGAPSDTMLLRSSTQLGCLFRSSLARELGRGSVPCPGLGTGLGIWHFCSACVDRIGSVAHTAIEPTMLSPSRIDLAGLKSATRLVWHASVGFAR